MKVKQRWHRIVNVTLALALVAALAIVLLPQPAYADPDPGWYDANWAYRKQITFTSDSAKIPSTQSYFPVLISLSSDSDLAADAQDDGDDILFTSSDGTTQLDHEIENFDGGTGQLVVWVEVPSLSTGTVIYMYYGNANASNQENVNGTWDEGGNGNYKMVQHLQEASLDGSDDEVVDSTVNDNDGKGQPANGGYNGPTPGATGRINSAFDFDGSDDYVDCGHGASLNITGSVTLEGWINMDADPGKDKWYECIAKPQYDFYLGGTGDNETTLCAWFKINGGKVDVWGKGDIDINPGNDTYCVVTFDGTDIKAYVNGQLDYTHNKPGSIDDSANDDLLIGAFSPPADYFYGIIDEVRISDTARSADWIKTCYNNQNSPSTFYTVGIEEYTLTINIVGNGSVAKSPDQATYHYGDTVQLTATADPGWSFDSWSGDLSGSTNPETITMDGDKSVTATFTIYALWVGGGGGGGALPQPPPPPSPPPLDLQVNVLGNITSVDIGEDRVLAGVVIATSSDERVTLTFADGTQVLSPDGNPPAELTVETILDPPDAPEGYHVIEAFDFGPDGATFSPPIEIAIRYDPDALPEGVDEANLVIAYYDEAAGEWVFETGVVHPAANTVTFSAGHFTTFAILGACEAVPTPTPQLTPTPTTTPGLGTDSWIGMGLCFIGLFGLVVGLIIRRR